MNPFRIYFKALTKDERQVLADKVDTSVAYLWQIAYEQRRCNESLAIEIEKATDRAVLVEQLRSDVDWAYIRASAQSIADSDISERVKAADDAQPPVGGVSDSSKMSRLERAA